MPEIEVVDIDKLEEDKTNPNRMSTKQFEGLKKVISKYGFLIPVITNKEMKIADGYHRWKAAKELGFKEIKIIRLEVEEVDRIQLRQILNKLSGRHDVKKDIDDFDVILSQRGNFKEIAELLGEPEKYFRDLMELRNAEMEQYLVIRKVDDDLRDKEINVKQLKLPLSKQQLDKIKDRFGDDEKILEIVDYFLVIE